MLYIVFEIGSLAFLLQTQGVLRLTSYKRPRPIPSSPAGLVGLLRFEGGVVPAIDPAVALINTTSRLLRSTRVAFCKMDGSERVLGVILESALETVQLDESDFSPLPVSRERCRCAGDLATVAGRLMQRVDFTELATEEVWDLVERAEAPR